MKVIQDMKLKLNEEIESLKKTQREIKMKMKYSGQDVKQKSQRLASTTKRHGKENFRSWRQVRRNG